MSGGFLLRIDVIFFSVLFGLVERYQNLSMITWHSFMAEKVVAKHSLGSFLSLDHPLWDDKNFVLVL